MAGWTSKSAGARSFSMRIARALSSRAEGEVLGESLAADAAGVEDGMLLPGLAGVREVTTIMPAARLTAAQRRQRHEARERDGVVNGAARGEPGGHLVELLKRALKLGGVSHDTDRRPHQRADLLERE